MIAHEPRSTGNQCRDTMAPRVPGGPPHEPDRLLGRALPHLRSSAAAPGDKAGRRRGHLVAGSGAPRAAIPRPRGRVRSSRPARTRRGASHPPAHAAREHSTRDRSALQRTDRARRPRPPARVLLRAASGSRPCQRQSLPTCQDYPLAATAPISRPPAPTVIVIARWLM